jgi:thiol-disulfide isomerase/thioredoxin
MRGNSYFRYFIVFLITAGIFVTAFYFNNIWNTRRLEEVRSIQESIATDILASEIQFTLLKQTPCRALDESVLSRELGDLGSRLSYMESTRGADDPEVKRLKKQYSILEIKDFLLMGELSQKCNIDSVSLLYFYEEGCKDCDRQGIVVTRLHELYPDLRVYSFDYGLDLSALQTLITIMKIEGDMPGIIIDDRVYNGFLSIEDLEEKLPVKFREERERQLAEEEDEAQKELEEAATENEQEESN